MEADTGVSQPRSRDSWGPRTWKRQEGPSPGGFGLGTGPCNTLVTASWPPELGENELVMFKQPSLWSLVKAAPRDKPLCVSENRSPLCPQPGRPSTCHHGCFNHNKPPDSRGRCRGPPSVWGSQPVLARSSSAQHTHWPLWERRQVTSVPLVTSAQLPGHARRRLDRQTVQEGAARRPCLFVPLSSL